MATPQVDFERLAQACIEGDLDELAAAAKQLGWTLTEPARAGLLHALGYREDQTEGFTIAQALGLLNQAASNRSGIALAEQPRTPKLGKQIAIAFRDDAHIHFGIRTASKSSMNPSHLWSELEGWFKRVDRNRGQLHKWAESAAGVVSVPLVERARVPTGEDLLAAVIADPDDVDRRLVYADWLLAQGDARGELIQLCEHRRTLDHEDPLLHARIKELVRSCRPRIAGSIARLASSYTLDRGFVTRIRMSAPTFAKHGERLLASHPIERFELEPISNEAVAQLARVPALARIRVLRVMERDGHGWRRLDELFRSPYLDALQRLELSMYVTDQGLQQAVAELRAPRLQSLFLREVDEAGLILAGLANNEIVRLRELEVVLQDAVDGLVVPVRADTVAFERLETLRIDAICGELGSWFENTRLPALTSLELGHNFPIDSLFWCPNLRRLSLGGGRFDAASLLTTVELHRKLEALRVWDMGSREVEQVLELALMLPRWHPLAELSLPMRGIDPQLVDRANQRFALESDGGAR